MMIPNSGDWCRRFGSVSQPHDHGRRLRTVSDFLGAHPPSQPVCLRSTVDDRRAEMADGPAHYVSSDDDIELGWSAWSERPSIPMTESELAHLRHYFGGYDDDEPATESYLLTIDQPVLDALNQFFRPSQRRNYFIRSDPSQITVGISDRRDRIEYSAEATATGFGEAVAKALEAEEAENRPAEPDGTGRRYRGVVRALSHDTTPAEHVRDVIRAAVSMAERVSPPQEYDGEDSPDLVEYAEELRREHLDTVLGVIRAGMRIARQAGVSETVEALFDHFDTLTALEY